MLEFGHVTVEDLVESFAGWQLGECSLPATGNPIWIVSPEQFRLWLEAGKIDKDGLVIGEL